MKRMILSVLIVCSLALGIQWAISESGNESVLRPGIVIQFGQYEQDNKKENGKEPIEWIILDVQDEKALLISKYALHCLPFHEKQADLSWSDSSIRAWLNGEFYNDSFTESEKNAIVLSAISNTAEDGFADYNPVDHDKTNDHVFLLSYREAMRFFPSRMTEKPPAPNLPVQMALVSAALQP